MQPFKDDEKLLEPCLPPWYDGEEEQKLELEDGEVSEETINEIIDSAYQKLKKHFDGYQLRDSQVDMSKLILTNLLHEQNLIVEAGTGIGKSFAYLIAAIAFSYLKAERVLVTTDTRNLQVQLYEKDLPTLYEIIDSDLLFALCLGSGNYYCQLRFRDSVDGGVVQDIVEQDELNDFKSWAEDIIASKKEGNSFELNLSMPGSFWSQVNRDSDGCPSNKCEFFSNCNYFRAKKNWQNSRILVCNHHLFLFHLLNEKRTLPEYGAIIFDEAHGFIETGYDIFTHSYSRESLHDQIKIFERSIKKSGALGAEKAEELKKDWDQLALDWDIFCSNWEVEMGLNFEEDKTIIVEKAQNINAANLVSYSEGLASQLKVVQEETEDSGILNSLKAAEKFLSRFHQFALMYHALDLQNNVFWGKKDKGRFLLNACNLNLGDELEQSLGEAKVWTSATLGYWPYSSPPSSKAELLKRGYFDNFLHSTFPSLSQDDSLTSKSVFFSPFDFKKNATLYIPKSVSAPAFSASDEAKEKYEDELLEEIVRLVELSQGGALVLFTSYYMLRKIGSQLQERINNNVISQDDYGAARALELFREDEDSVLLGTSSFWQGVDVSGRGLRMLIITKLMFTPPNDPIFKARSDLLERKGKNSFRELSLPHAAGMLRQAFGRLIRNESDTGVVAILDSRVLEKSYGRVLLSNLPPATLMQNYESLEKHVTKQKMFVTKGDKP